MAKRMDRSQVVKKFVPKLESLIWVDGQFNSTEHISGLFGGYLSALHEVFGDSVVDFAREIIEQERNSASAKFFRTAMFAQDLLNDMVDPADLPDVMR